MIIDHFPNFIQRIIKNSEDDFYHIVHGCRHCGYAGNLHRHASYHRTIICKEITARVRIQRVICPNCKKTHAIIPSDLIPYFQHTLETIIRLLEFIISKKASYSQSLTVYRMFNLSFSSAHINLYIRRFKSNLNNVVLPEPFFPNNPVTLLVVKSIFTCCSPFNFWISILLRYRWTSCISFL